MGKRCDQKPSVRLGLWRLAGGSGGQGEHEEIGSYTLNRESEGMKRKVKPGESSWKKEPIGING